MTSSTVYVDSPNDPNYTTADARTTLYGYDWRDRQLWTMVDDYTDDPNHPGSTRKTYTFNTYDNLDDVVDVTRYYDKANTSGLPNNAPNAIDPIIGRSGAAYDSLGQVYQTLSYNQNGTVATVSNTWYDPDGNVIKTQDGGTQQFVKTKYDGLDQPIHVYDGYDTTPEPIATSGTYPAAVDVSGDVVLEETDTSYDAAGNAAFATRTQQGQPHPPARRWIKMPAVPRSSAKGMTGWLGRRVGRRPMTLRFWLPCDTNG